jgi:hypothetical protein
LTLWANKRTGWMELYVKLNEDEELIWTGESPWANSIVEMLTKLGHEVTVEMND